MTSELSRPCWQQSLRKEALKIAWWRDADRNLPRCGKAHPKRSFHELRSGRLWELEGRTLCDVGRKQAGVWTRDGRQAQKGSRGNDISRPCALHATFVAAVAIPAPSTAFPLTSHRPRIARQDSPLISFYFARPICTRRTALIHDNHNPRLNPKTRIHHDTCHRSTDAIRSTIPARPSSPAGGRAWSPQGPSRPTQTTPSSSPTSCAPARPRGCAGAGRCVSTTTLAAGPPVPLPHRRFPHPATPTAPRARARMRPQYGPSSSSRPAHRARNRAQTSTRTPQGRYGGTGRAEEEGRCRYRCRAQGVQQRACRLWRS